MSNQPDLTGLRIGEFQQKNEDAEKLCKKSKDSYLISTEKNHAAQHSRHSGLTFTGLYEWEGMCMRQVTVARRLGYEIKQQEGALAEVVEHAR